MRSKITPINSIARKLPISAAVASSFVSICTPLLFYILLFMPLVAESEDRVDVLEEAIVEQENPTDSVVLEESHSSQQVFDNIDDTSQSFPGDDSSFEEINSQVFTDSTPDQLISGAPEVSNDEHSNVGLDSAGEEGNGTIALGESNEMDDPIYQIKEIRFIGDSEVLDLCEWKEDGRVIGNLRKKIEEGLLNQRMTDSDLLRRVGEYQSILRNEFYRAADTFRVPRPLDSDGIVEIVIEAGRYGKMSFGDSQPDATTASPKFSEKFFSEGQLRYKLADLREGDFFRYDELYRILYGINSHPDLTVDTTLSQRVERTEADSEYGELSLRRKFIDMQFEVKESLPFHVVSEVNNYGTEDTDEWRGSLTAQHLNLTRHDDVLTVEAISATDPSALWAGAASYYRPFRKMPAAFTLLGGYSELDNDQLLEGIDLLGVGSFVGAQFSYDLLRRKRHDLKITAGIMRRSIEDELVLGGESMPRKVELTPLNVAFIYSNPIPDALGGRNFLTWQSIGHISEFLGSSGDDEFSVQRETAEADYLIEKIQAARLQKLASASNPPLLFTRLEGQWATSALIPAEQLGIGGHDSVRGYKEREVLGDLGVNGTVEVRSPLWSLNRVAPAEDNTSVPLSETPTRIGWQILGFTDAGYSSLEDALPGEDESETLWSVGLGLRMEFRMTEKIQSYLKFDWGFPLEETELSDSDGAGHISFQVQF